MFGTVVKTRYMTIILINVIIVFNIIHSSEDNEKLAGFIYILIWTQADFEPFNFIDLGWKAFENCTFKNCFLIDDHDYFTNILDFEVIMFNVVNLEVDMNLPKNRSEEQKYFMYGVEPAGYHVLPEEFNGFFNYTFTYKLSSNVTIPCLVVKDQYNEVVGPKIDMEWIKLSEMNETSVNVKNKLRNKHIAAAWIVSNCSPHYRRLYAYDLQKELARYGHHLDVYGKCGTIQCPRGVYGRCGNTDCPNYENMNECLLFVESDYYFYLSFENSFGEDYVTEKLLHALQNYAVPVVFGRANYARFMPEGIYLDANVMEPDKMAERMNEIIKDNNSYYEFFKWHEYYSYHFTGGDRYSGEVCRLCAFLNNNKDQKSILEDIAGWWNEVQPPLPLGDELSYSAETAVETIFSNIFSFLDPD